MSTTRHSRATKIICTLGPVSSSPEMIGRLIEAGANIFRLNMSHGKHSWLREIILRIRQKAEEQQANIAILVDLQGPSIRTGELDEPYHLLPDDELEIRLNTASPSLPYSTTVNYDGLLEDVKSGDTIVVDNGGILMKVKSIGSDRMTCTVLTEGTFGSRRHINLPGVILRLPALTEKDIADLQVAIECDADYIAMSFVRSAEHVAELRRHIHSLHGKAQIIAKIEDQQAVKHIDDIIKSADVIMVARGDLGIEVNIEELPLIQRRIITHCLRYGTRCIVATHMLESMITSPTPTRAEVTDVSNAIMEQADAVMLSGETSVGLYPIHCIETLDSIARRMERAHISLDLSDRAVLKSDRQKATKAAVSLADSVDEASLIIFTRRGLAATQASVLRPKKAPIYAFSNDPCVVRQLSLARGVTAFEAAFHKDPAKMIDAAIAYLKEKKLISTGQPVVILGDSLQGEFIADSIIFLRVE